VTNPGADLTVHVEALYPWGIVPQAPDFGWKGEFRGEFGPGFGGKGGFIGKEGEGFRQEGRRFGRGARPNFGPGTALPQDQPGTANQPEALLLIAMQRPGVTVWKVANAVLGAVAMIGFVVYWLSIAWWVFADARRRSSKAFAWGILALLTNLVGAAVYLIARREQRTCNGCGANVERSFNNCPHCGHALKRNCVNCSQSLKQGWTYCANCGTPADPDQ
jgi:hypothetical protein